MDSLFVDFKKAYGEGHGYDLSMTLSPIPSLSDPNRLHAFFRSTNHASAKTDFKYQILYDNSMSFKLPIEEGNGWVEVYFAYWKAVGDILNAETVSKSGAKVNGCDFIIIVAVGMAVLGLDFCLFAGKPFSQEPPPSRDL